ncbi:MAG: hypothetical protein K2K04_03670 [Clostridia bacterium]|nr:hypothetical protein [Clostridia bacterium]
MNELKSFKLNKIALSVSAVLALVIYTVSALLQNCLPIEMLFVAAATLAVHNIITAFNKTKDRRTSVVYGIIGFIEAVIAVFFLVYLILQRCGVM